MGLLIVLHWMLQWYPDIPGIAVRGLDPLLLGDGSLGSEVRSSRLGSVVVVVGGCRQS
jgi:hypothetical protein